MNCSNALGQGKRSKKCNQEIPKFFDPLHSFLECKRGQQRDKCKVIKSLIRSDGPCVSSRN